MAFSFHPGQLQRLRSGSRQLAEQAAANESDIQQLLTTVQTDLSETRAALDLALTAYGTDGPVCQVLRNQVARHSAGVEAATALCLRARWHQLAADRLVVEVADPEGRTPAKRRAVLVVDDHRDSRETLATVLSESGFLVRTASNGLEAVLTAYEIKPAVIVMDLMMPVLDGLEATRLIKAIDELRDACVIAHTATPPAVAPRASLFSEVLLKPAPPDLMVATVQRYALRAV